MALVKWDICCQPMKVGSFGLRRLVPQSTSFFMKLAYQIVTKPDTLWVRVLRSKYKMLDVCPLLVNRSNCSYVLRSISNVWDQFRKNLYWSLGNGRSVSFIQDVWIVDLGPLHEHLYSNVVILAHLKVADFVDPDGCWKWSKLRHYFSSEILDYIVVCHPPNDTLGNDTCLWRPNVNGRFSIKAAYKSIVQFDVSHVNTRWKEIWNNALPPRIKHFLWLVMHRRLLTNCKRVRRRLTNEAGCLICGGSQETVLHALRDCWFATEAWMKIILADCVFIFFELDLAEWVSANLRGEFGIGSGGVESRVIFADLCWILWKNSNKYIFEQVIGKVEDMVRSTECFAVNVCETNLKGSRSRDSRAVMARWCSANHGWIKVNMDRATNKNGNWSKAGMYYGTYLGIGLKGLEDLLGGAWLGYSKVIIETDCMMAVNMIKECLGSTPSMALVKKMKEVS
ncbi:hypothetical protein Goari_013845 [Gossypium aridum]|uniref:Reverse transcriptase zinc-binding domain-containing protein n=1 Tax=Gossypium aridum TaxID=34290 RepID=A0A7J8XG45_GOSAI|nr:hypothetical protein [Gossypium aridum]